MIELDQSHSTRFSFLDPGVFFDGAVTGGPEVEAVGGAFAAEVALPVGIAVGGRGPEAPDGAADGEVADAEGSGVEEAGAAVRVPDPGEASGSGIVAAGVECATSL